MANPSRSWRDQYRVSRHHWLTRQRQASAITEPDPIDDDAGSRRLAIFAMMSIVFASYHLIETMIRLARRAPKSP